MTTCRPFCHSEPVRRSLLQHMKVLADTYVRYVITGFYVPTIHPLHAIRSALLADRRLTGRGKCDVLIACCGNDVYVIYKKEELNIDESWTLLRGGSVFLIREEGRAHRRLERR